MWFLRKKKEKETPVIRREFEYQTDVTHANIISKGLRYSTKDSEQIISWQDSYSDGFALFRTKNGRWFRCNRDIDNHTWFSFDSGKYICQTNVKYSNIIHVNEDYAKITIGEHDVQKYLELWGDEVEEA